MLSPKIKFAFAFVLGFLYSCSTTKLTSTKFKSEDLQNILLFETNSLSYTLNFSNQVFKNDSLSNLQDKSFQEILINFKDSLRITSTIKLADSTNFQRALVAIIEHGFSDGYFYEIKTYHVPPAMDSILRANNRRYGLMIINFGVFRDQFDEFKRGVARNEIALKYDNYFPDEFLSKTYAAIIDTSKQDFILLSRNLKKQNPLSTKTIHKQFKELFAGIFFSEGCCP